MITVWYSIVADTGEVAIYARRPFVSTDEIREVAAALTDEGRAGWVCRVNGRGRFADPELAFGTPALAFEEACDAAPDLFCSPGA